MLSSNSSVLLRADSRYTASSPTAACYISSTSTVSVPPAVAAMEGTGGVAHRRWGTSGSGSQYSFRTSVSSTADIGGAVVEVEEATPPVGDKVFVAVAQDVKYGKSTLLWALQNLAKDGAKVAIAHVHCPAQMIPMMGAKVHYTRMNQKLVNDYREKERGKAEEKLDEYVLICKTLKVSCEKLIIEKDDVAKGLEDLIALHGITELVMGAAADKHYSKKMKTPKSKTALKLMETAALSCKIWFTCKGYLVCTREAKTAIPAIPPSPAPTVTSMLSASSISSHMRSMTIRQSESEASSSTGSPIDDLNRSRTKVTRYPSQGAGGTLSRQFEPFELNDNCSPVRTPVSSMDSWDEFGRRSQSSWYDLSRNHDALSISGSAKRHPQQESDNDPFSSPPRELEKPGVDADMYGRLEEALREAQDSKKEAYEESSKRRKAERELISALQKAKELGNLYHHEMRQRKIIEETLARQMQEIEETKRQYDTIVRMISTQVWPNGHLGLELAP